MRRLNHTICSRSRFVQALVCLFILLFPTICFSQIIQQDIKTRRLLLELGAGYLNVVRENQIDLDSGLALAAKRNQLSRMAVIAEGNDEILLDPENKWIATENMNEARIQAILTKGVKRIQLLNIIGSYYIFQPAGRKNDLDSALIYLEQARKEAEASADQKILCQNLRLSGKYYLDAGDLPQANKTFGQAITLAKKYGYPEEEAMCLLYWAAFSPFQPALISERIARLKAADSLFEKTGDVHNRIVTGTDIGYLSFATGQLTESKNFFMKVLDLEKKIGFPFTHYTTDLLSMMEFGQAHQGEALEYAFSSIKSAEAAKDNTIKGYLFARIGDGYSSRHRGRESVDWYLKALDEFQRVGDDPFRVLRPIFDVLKSTGENKYAIQLAQQVLKKNIATDLLQKQGVYLTLASLSISEHLFSDAEGYLRKAEDIQEEMNLRDGKLNTSEFDFNMANLYFEIHQYEKARSHYNKLKSADIKLPINRANLMEFRLYRIDSAEGNFQGAISHLKNYMQWEKLLSDEKESKTNQNLRVQYETEKKDNNIKILSQQAELQKAQIKQDRLTKNVAIGGAALLLLFLGLLYNRYRLKQSQQKVVTEKNIALQHLVQEKEFLMKEIHHRVKNNLQIVISLLNTQSKFLNNEEAIAAISESRHRMQAMSLIHQKLYQSDNVAFVAMPAYIRELVDYLDMSFNTGQRISFELNIDPIDLDISQAIPVGLILNEAVTNCIKHAFTDQPNGVIRVTMRKMEDGIIFLEISDNGKGLPPDFDFITSQSLGIRLIRGLIEQIGGELNFSDQDGCRIATTFKQDLVLKPVAI